MEEAEGNLRKIQGTVIGKWEEGKKNRDWKRSGLGYGKRE